MASPTEPEPTSGVQGEHSPEPTERLEFIPPSLESSGVDTVKDVDLVAHPSSPPLRISGGGSAGEFRSGSRTDSRIGTVLGRLKIASLLGRGGMGTVYEAQDPILGRKVAIKLLSESKAEDPEAQARFLREARAVARLSHPNVVAIYEINDTPPDRYLVLEYVDGGSLADALKDGPISWREATREIEQACRGLTVAHKAKLIHRDLKPANLLRSTHGIVKLTDFGLVKETGLKGVDLTQDNKTLGTPSFMSPEQCHAQPLDVRSEIYSLGATYYALLTGVAPYDDQGSSTGVMMGHCYKPTPDPRARNPELPAEVSHIVLKAMAKRPEERYQTAEEMRCDIQKVLKRSKNETTQGKPRARGAGISGSGQTGATGWGIPSISSRRAWLTATVAAGSFLAGSAGVTWARRRRKPGLMVSQETGGESTTGPAATASQSAGSQSPIKIGLLASESGTLMACESGTIQGIQLAVKRINQQGGVLGRPILAVTGNGRSRPEVFAEEADRLISAEGVNALFGCWSSACRKAVKEVVERRSALLFYPTPFEGLELSPWIVYVGNSANQQVLPALEWCREVGKRRLFLVGSDYVYPRAVLAIIQDQLPGLGCELVGDAFVRLGQIDMTVPVEQIRQARPDLILNLINGDSNVSFFRSLREAGILAETTPSLSFCLNSGSIRAIDPELLAGDYFAGSYFESLLQTENAAFLGEFRTAYGPSRVPTDSTETAYASVLLWAAAVEAAQSLDPAMVRQAVRNQSISAPEGPIRVDASTQYCSRFFRLAQIDSDGRYRVLKSSSDLIQPIPFPPSRTPEAWEQTLKQLRQGWNGNWQAESSNTPA